MVLLHRCAYLCSSRISMHLGGGISGVGFSAVDLAIQKSKSRNGEIELTADLFSGGNVSSISLSSRLLRSWDGVFALRESDQWHVHMMIHSLKVSKISRERNIIETN